MHHSLSLVIHPTYEQVQVALYTNSSLIQHLFLDKKEASKQLIPTIDILLKTNSLTFSNIDTIICNQGPGPYTTMRVALTTANGLAFKKPINLIGVNALDAALHEIDAYKYGLTVLLFNAFNQEFYTVIIHQSEEILRGCLPLGQLFEKIDAVHTKPIHFFGNGALLYKRELLIKFENRAIINEFTYPSISTLTLLGQKNSKHEPTNRTKELMPLYMKSAYSI